MKRITLAMAAVALTLGISGTASAATSSAALNVSVTITPACTVSTTPVSFPNYPGGNVNATGSINVNCVAGTAYSVGVDGGSYRIGTTRNVGDEFSPGRVSYGLYKDAARTVEFGDGASQPGGQLAGQVGTGVTQSIPVFGKLLPGATLPPAGMYADFVTVIVTY